MITVPYYDTEMPQDGVSVMAGGGAVCLKPNCGRTFKSLGTAKRHYKEYHTAAADQSYPCHICGMVFKLKRKRGEHQSRAHGIRGLVGNVHMPN